MYNINGGFPLQAEDVLEQLNFDELNITSQDDDILDETEAAGEFTRIPTHHMHTPCTRPHVHP